MQPKIPPDHHNPDFAPDNTVQFFYNVSDKKTYSQISSKIPIHK